jgi:hypothetical protein
MKNISATLKFYKMGHEAPEPEWPCSDLGSFEFGALVPKRENKEVRKRRIFKLCFLKGKRIDLKKIIPQRCFFFDTNQISA